MFVVLFVVCFVVCVVVFWFALDLSCVYTCLGELVLVVGFCLGCYTCFVASFRFCWVCDL